MIKMQIIRVFQYVKTCIVLCEPCILFTDHPVCSILGADMCGYPAAGLVRPSPAVCICFARRPARGAAPLVLAVSAHYYCWPVVRKTKKSIIVFGQQGKLDFRVHISGQQ